MRQSQGAHGLSALKTLKCFVTSPNVTGTVVPSSERLSDLITDSAALRGISSVVELGPGTGALTRKIVQKMPEDARFFALEINPEFARDVQERYPTVRVHCDSAVNVRKYLEDAGLKACDRIISSLPWAMFDETLQDEILDAILEALAPGGLLLTFAYLHGLALPAGLRFRRKLFSRFREVTQTRTVWRNVPPAFVYCAEK